MTATARILPGRTLNRPCCFCQHLFPAARMQCPSCLRNNPDIPLATNNADGRFGCKRLSEISSIPQERLYTKFLDKAFGGKALSTPKGSPLDWGPGGVNTAVYLIGGAPGAGKSTLMLQTLDIICGILQRDALYIGVEETEEEINDRALRLELPNRHRIWLYGIGNNTDIGSVIMAFNPCAIVLDSVPGLTGGDLQAAVDMCKTLKLFSARLKAPCFVIDHVTKQDAFAGLRALEHAVDWTGTFFAVEDNSRPKEDWVRELTVLKNRNGRAHIISEFEMTPTGLEAILEYRDGEEPGAEAELNSEVSEDGEEEGEEDNDGLHD